MEQICSMKLTFLGLHKVGTITLRKQDEVHRRLFLGHPEDENIKYFRNVGTYTECSARYAKFLNVIL